MYPNLTWQLAKIRQTEALKEAAQRQAFRSVEDNNPNGLVFGPIFGLVLVSLSDLTCRARLWLNDDSNCSKHQPTNQNEKAE